VDGGTIAEPIDAFGTRVYELPFGPEPEDDLAIDPGNLTLNPSWETMVSVGTPANCYISVGADRASTAFVDPRIARHGRHSLRLITPTDGGGLMVQPHWVPLEAGRPYRASIWARGARTGPRFRLSLDGVGNQEFELTDEWREYELTGTPDQAHAMAQIHLRLETAGTAWCDLLQVVPQERP